MTTEAHPQQVARPGATVLGGLAFRFPLRYRVVWIALLGLILLCVATAPDTLHGEALKSVTALAGVLAITASGQLLVVMVGGIDLSVPAVMTLAAIIILKEAPDTNHHFVPVIAATLIAGGAVGLVNGLLISVAKLNAMIVTLAMVGIVVGATAFYTGPTFSPSGSVPPKLADFCGKYLGVVSSVALAAIVILALIAITLRRTRLGRNFLATGTNPTAAHILGLKVRRYGITAYVLAGVLYAAAGVLLAGIVVQPDTSLGTSYQLTSIVAVVLGGALFGGGPASLTCTGAGAVFLVLLDEYLAIRNIAPGLRVLTQGAVLLVAVALVTTTSRGSLRTPEFITSLRRRT